MVLMVFFSSRISPSHIHRDLAREIAVGDRRRHFGDVAHLSRQVRGHRVDGVGQILPRARDALHFRLTAEFPFRTDFARHASDFADANELSWSTIVFTTFAVRANSPFERRPSTSSGIVWSDRPLQPR